MARRQGLFVLVLLIVFAVTVPLGAQTVTGTLQGTVTDRSNSRLPGVTITIRNMETGLERIVTTNGEGFFNAPFLPLGTYSVSAELSGFGTMRRESVPVNLNQTTVQEFMIDPQVSETITVSADAPRINVTDGEVKQTMRSEEIMTLPQQNQNSFLSLAAAFSGYNEHPPAFATSGDNPTLSTGSSINFNGAGTRGTSFQINGVNNDDSSENQHRQGVALATIKSFQVLSNSFSAEFGRGYGAVVLVQTKSGTNDLAGEIYGYAQDNEWNARPTLDLVKPPRTRYQYGVTAGFPISRDRLFAFVNGDMLESEGSDVVTRSFWTTADLAIPRLTRGNDTPANRAWQDSILARFPDLQPNAPQIHSRAYQYPQFFNRPDEDYSGRIDWNASMSNNVNARYQRSSQVRENEELIIGEQTLQDNRQSNFGVSWTGTLSANTVQEARYGLGLRSTNVDILAGNDTPIVRFAGILNGTIIGNASAFPINRNQRDQQLVYNISSARWAKHTMKLGTDLRRSWLNDRAEDRNRGFWNFGATCRGVTYPTGFHAFMDGCISSFQKSFGPSYLENLLTEYNFYAQDDWRPWDNVIFNLGVRYEMVNAPEEKEDRIDYFMGNSDYIDPRLGFAYTPDWSGNRFLRAMTGGQGRFSIRGGYGIYHGRVFQSVFSQVGASVRYNPPNAASIDVNSLNLADPTEGFVFVPGRPLTTRVNLTLIDPDLVMPETRQWNLTFERQMGRQSRLRLSYVGTLGKGLLQYRLDNLPVKPGAPGSAAAWVVAADWRCAGTGQPGQAVNAACPVAVPIAANEVSLRFPRTNERRPDTRYGTNLIVDNLGESSYHAGQFEFETGLMRGFQGRVTYTFGKNLDTGSEATFVGAGDINIFPPDSDSYKRGLGRFDVRHRATVTGSYSLPFFADRTDWMGQLLGGWQLSTFIRLSSGTPFTIVDGGAADIDFDGVGNARPVCVNPEFCGGWHVNNPNTSRNEMPASAYRRVVYGDTLDDMIGRNTFFTDGTESVDLGLYKTFRLPIAQHSLVFRLDVFNVFNHVTWSFPVNDINNVNFGRIIATAYSPRTVQVGLRYIY
jgi:hypothetical protein